MDGSVGLLTAFAAGLVSFLSPCVLPLIPAYLSFMTGYTATELGEGTPELRQVLVPSLLFVAGFTVVFVSLGATASVLGSLVFGYRELLVRVSGLVVFVFGLLMIGVIRAPWLYGEARFDLSRARPFGRAAALVMGMAFAFGWTPCVGPVLGAILALAGSSGNIGQGATLLAAYSMGLGVPFVLTALLFGRVRPVLAWLNRHALAVNRVAGASLMIVGLLIFTNRLTVLAGWFARVLPSIAQ
ncbi:MAG: cytochrome c biogenesis protein CcdA [Coriobacteriia bacterium]|nr:cytochrome c biogenesis protein CcdA [Coriobacteriia bacterium]